MKPEPHHAHAHLPIVHPAMPLLTVAQAAARLAVCGKTVRRRITEGHLVALRIGGNLRISEADLRRYNEGCVDG